MTQEELDKSEENYLKSLANNPNDDFIHYKYAVLLLGQKNREHEAEMHFKKALEINPDHAGFHYTYAILLQSLDRKTEAEEHYKNALKINPNHASAHNYYAVLLQSLDRKTEAEEHYKNALKINPNDFRTHNNYANLLRKNNRFYEAEEHARIAIQLKPNYPWALATLGDILADEEYYQEALNEYQKALNGSISKNPSLESEIFNNMGWSYSKLGQEATAQDLFRKANILDPMNVKAIRNLRAINKAIKSNPSRNHIRYLAIPGCILISFFILFLSNKISETGFIAQSVLLTAVMIFMLYSNELARFKMGTLELEMNEQRSESKINLERY